MTLPARLRAAGYEVAAFGKTHFYAPRRHEFDLAVDYPDYLGWLDEKGADPLPPGGPVLGPWRPFADPPAAWLNAGVRAYPAADGDMFGTYLADHAAAFLARPRTRPFFLYVSFHETHSPFNFPAGWPRRDPGEFAAPPVSPAEWAECPEVFRELADADRRGVIAAYHTSAHFLDRNVGRVLDALDRGGRAGDTLVLFTSDHGYFVGQRGRFEKHACLDPAVRTAVLARWPGVIPAGRASAALASLVDLAPTVLVACGLPVPLELHGRSLLPLWQGEADTHRNRVYLDYADNAEAGVRTDRWKLVYCAGTRLWRDGYAAPGDPRPWVRLYDLAADPGEVVNLAGLPAVAGVGEELLTDLADHVRRTDRRPVPAGDDPLAVLGALLGPPDADPLAEFLRRRGGD